MYIDPLVAKILKIKVIKQDNTGHKKYTAVYSVRRLNIKYT